MFPQNVQREAYECSILQVCRPPCHCVMYCSCEGFLKLLVPSWEKLSNTKVISSVCDCNRENCFLRDLIRSLLAGFPGSRSEPLHLSSVSVSSISSVIHQVISVQLKCHRGPSPHSCWDQPTTVTETCYLVFCLYFCSFLYRMQTLAPLSHLDE